MSKESLLNSSFKYVEQDPDYRGDTLDGKYEKGPEETRSCTDVLCCLLFVALIGGLGYIAVLAFEAGNPTYLAYPFDQAGNQCRYSPGYSNYTYIFITDFLADPLNITFVCVSECPISGSNQIDCHPFGGMNCRDLRSYASTPLFTYCSPVNQTDLIEVMAIVGQIPVLQQYFSDAFMAWPIILGVIGASLAYSLIYFFLIRHFASLIVWAMLIIMLVLQFAIGTISILLPHLQFLQDILNYNSLPASFRDATYQEIVGGLCIAIGILTIIVLCCLRNQIRIAIGIIKAAADFARNCCSAMLLPLYTTILQVIFLVFWVTVMLYLFSSNSGPTPNIDKTPFAWITWNQTNQYMILVYLFGLFWVINFFSGLSAFWVNSATAIWYFECGSPNAPILRSFCRSFYHLGSIAFGSLLIAIVQFIRVVLEIINNRMKSQTLGLGEATSTQYAVKCAECLIACFERFIRFLTENAYILMAITGKNFCNSAKESFYLILRSTAQFAVSHGTTKLFFGMGIILIDSMSCVTGYLLITNVDPFRTSVHSPVFMTIIFAIAALPIAWAFMEFYEKAANTVLMCYCIEMDLNTRKSKCPAGLRNFLNQYVTTSSLLRDE